MRVTSILCPATLIMVVLSCAGGGPAGPGSQGSVHVVLSTAALEFPADQSEGAVTLTNPGSEPVTWRAEGMAAWLAVAPVSGTLAPGASTVAVRVVRAGLAPGTYKSVVHIIAGSDDIALSVTAEVDARPLASLDATEIDFGPSTASAQLVLSNSGNAPLAWTLTGPAWLAVAPAGGSLAAGTGLTVVLTPDRGALAPGVHTTTLTLASDGGSAAVTLRIEVPAPPPPPLLRAQPASIAFGETAETANLTIANDGGAALAWNAAADEPWIGLGRTSGSLAPGASEVIVVTASRQSLGAGTHAGTVTVTSNGGAAAVGVTLQVAAPPAGSVALAGTVTDQFSGAGLAGLTVSFADATATTGSGGSFQVPGAPSSLLRELTINGPGVVPRSTFARSTDAYWRAIPVSFDVDAFDDMAREYEPRTIRWLQTPSLYIDTRHVGPDQGSQLAAWIAEAQGSAAGFAAQWANGVVGTPSVTVGGSPPEDGTPGWIVIRFDDDPSHYSGPNTVGNARTGWSAGRAILYSTILLRFSLVSGSGLSTARTAVLGHELGHAMGMGHMDGGTTSIMTPSVSIAGLSSFDARAGAILYDRSPGNSFPDVDSVFFYVGDLVPSALPAGENRWICDTPGRELAP